MSKEVSEKQKTNPLVYILGIPLGIYILVLSYNAWERDRLFRECSKNIEYLGYTIYSGTAYKLGNSQAVSKDRVPNCLQVLEK